MRLALSFVAILLLVTGCPGTTNRAARSTADDVDNQNSEDVTDLNDNTDDSTSPEDPTDPEEPTDPEDPVDPPPPDDNTELPEVPEDLPPGSDFFLALFSGPPPDGAVEASLGSDSVSIVSTDETDGVYTIELSILTSDAGTVEAKGSAIGTAGITQLAESLPIVAEATNLTIDISPLVAILDPQSPRFSLVVVFGVAAE